MVIAFDRLVRDYRRCLHTLETRLEKYSRVSDENTILCHLHVFIIEYHRLEAIAVPNVCFVIDMVLVVEDFRVQRVNRIIHGIEISSFYWYCKPVLLTMSEYYISRQHVEEKIRFLLREMSQFIRDNCSIYKYYISHELEWNACLYLECLIYAFKRESNWSSVIF